MSVSYKLIGKRWLRKYTSAKATPVYAAESEVSKLANSLCDVKWQRVTPKDAIMTYHTNEVVYWSDPVEKTGGVTGLDYNVMIRDEFDAALFCGGHVSETHKVYGNAACYRFILPDMTTYPLLNSLRVNVTSDPYNSTGARIAIFTNSTGVIPTACSDCRQGSAPSGSHSCTRSGNAWTTNDTYADGVAPRDAREITSGGKTTTNWYPVNGSCTFNLATPLQLQKYLYVFVVLENYNVCRGNWIEGCSFIENLIDVTTSTAITGWSSGGTVDLSGDDAVDTGSSTSVDIVKDGVVPDVSGATSPVVAMSVLSSGTVVRRTGYVTDALPQVTDELTSANVASGLATLYGKFLTDSFETGTLPCCCPKFKTFGAGFCVSHGSESSYRDSIGDIASPMALNLTASSLVIPFGLPKGFVASKAKFDWSKWLRTVAPSPGAKFNFWLKPDEFETEYPEDVLKRHEIYDASVSTVDGWKLLGTSDASDGQAVIDIAEQCSRTIDGTSTILMTAYMPQDRIASIVDKFSRGTNSMWYDSVTPDDLLAVLSDYPYFSESSSYKVGDVVQYGTNEAAVWSTCGSTGGTVYTTLATNGSIWVAGSSSGLKYSRGGDVFLSTNVSSAIIQVIGFSDGRFFAAGGSKVYSCLTSDRSTWNSVTLPSPVRFIIGSSSGYDVMACTSSGLYNVNCQAGTYSLVGVSYGKSNEMCKTSVVSMPWIVAADCGMYVSDGTTATKASVSGPFKSLNGICVASNSLAAAYSNCGIFVSSNMSDWAYATGISDFVNDVEYGNGVFIIATDTALFRYVVSSSSIEATSAPQKKYLHAVYTSGVWFANSEDGTLYRSENAVGWTPVLTEIGSDVPRIFDCSLGLMMVGTSTGYAVSSDAGVNWRKIVEYDPESPSTTFFVGGIKSSYETADTYGNLSFVASDTGLYSARPVSADYSGSDYNVSESSWFNVQHVYLKLLNSSVLAPTSRGYAPWNCIESLSNITGLESYLFAGGRSGLFAYDTRDNIWDGRYGYSDARGKWKQQAESASMGEVTSIIPVTSGGTNTAFAVAKNGLFRYFGSSEASKAYPIDFVVRNGKLYNVEPYYTAQYPGDYDTACDYLDYFPNVYPHGAKYRVVYHTPASPYAPYNTTYVSIDPLWQYISLPIDSSDVVTYYTPDGTQKTFSFTWAKSGGTGDSPRLWHATISGGDFDGVTGSDHTTDEGLPKDFITFQCSHTYSGGYTLGFTLYILVGDLKTVGSTTSREILAVYADNPFVKCTTIPATGDWSMYTIRGQRFLMSFTTESSGDTVMNITFNAGAWRNMNEIWKLPSQNPPMFSDVKWTGSALVATVANSRFVYKSTDLGFHWSVSENLMEYGAFTHVAEGNGVSVAATESDGLFSSVDNGMSWNRTLVHPSPFRGVKFVNGKWFAFTASATFVSADGKTWTQADTFPSGVRCVSYMHGRYSIGTDSGSYWSVNGTSWTASDIDGAVSDLSHGTDKWFAATDDGVKYSGDTVLLNRVTTPSQSVPGFYVLESTAAVWIGGSCRGEGLSYSSDGTEWHQSNVKSGTFYTVCPAPFGWAAGGDSGLYRSTNGSTWTKIGDVTGTVRKIVYDEDTGVTLAVGPGLLYKTTNGTSWTSVFPKFLKVCSDRDGKFVSCSANGLFTSSDCKSWYPVTSVFGTAFETVKYDPYSDKFFAKTASGWYQSSNSTTWSAVTMPSGVVLDDLFIRGSQHYGYDGSAFYCESGGSWVSSSPGVGTISSACHNGSGHFYVVGSSGAKVTADGSTWTTIPGIDGTPKKILSNCTSSSSYGRCVVVLQTDGKVFARNDTAGSFSDFTPNGGPKAVDLLLCTVQSSSSSYWTLVTEGDVTYHAMSFGGEFFSWSETQGAPSGISNVRYVYGHFYAIANEAVYHQKSSRVNGRYVDTWTHKVMEDGLYDLDPIGGNSFGAMLYGSNGSVYQSDNTFPFNSVSRIFSGGGSSFETVGMDGSGSCIVAGYGAAYKSIDSGATWSYLSSVTTQVNDIAFFSSKWITAGEGGIKYSSDGGTTWTGAIASVGTKLCVGDGSIVACRVGGVSMSTDGATWAESNFSGVTTLNARFTTEVRWTEVQGISDQFTNIEWDSTNSKFVATSVKYKYYSATGETWSMSPWNNFATSKSNNSYLTGATWASIYNSKFWYRSSATGSINSNQCTDVAGTALDIWAPTSYGAQRAAWIMRSTEGYYRAYYSYSRYTPAFQKLSGANTEITSSVYGGSVKYDSTGAYYKTTGSDTWTKITEIYQPDSAAAAKVEGGVVYWQYPAGSGTWTAVSGTSGVNTSNIRVYAGDIRYYDNDASQYVTLQVPALKAALKLSGAGTIVGICGHDYYSEPVLFTTDGTMMMFSNATGVSGIWQIIPHDKTKMAMAFSSGAKFIRANSAGTGVEVSSNGTSWTSVAGYPGTEAIQSVGIIDLKFTVVTASAIYTCPLTGSTWTTSSFPSTLPEYVQSSGGVKLKVSGDKLMLSSALGWVAVGYSKMSNDMYRIHPALLTSAGSTWTKHPEIECLYEYGVNCPVYAAADRGNQWLVSGTLGTASGDVSDDTTWTRLYNSYIAPVTGVYEKDGYRFVCMAGLGALVSVNSGSSWHRSLLYLGTVKAMASGNGNWVAVGDFGIRRSLGFLGSGFSSASSDYGFVDVDGSSDISGSEFHDVVYYNGVWLAAGSSGLFRCATTGAPSTWSKVASGACHKILRSEACWIVLTSGGVLRSTDSLTWTKITVGSSSTTYNLGIMSEGVFVVANNYMAVENSTQDIFYSADGITWNRSSITLNDSISTTLGSFSSFAEHGGVILATRILYGVSGVGGIWRSTDRGASWKRIDGTAYSSYTKVYWSDRDRCWYVGGTSGFRYSIDGIKWISVLDGLSWGTFDVNCIADTVTGVNIGFDPLGTVIDSQYNLLTAVSLTFPSVKVYRCTERVKVPGLFDPTKWTEVDTPTRIRMNGSLGLCIPDVTLYS